jgi:hypothetical protein
MAQVQVQLQAQTNEFEYRNQAVAIIVGKVNLWLTQNRFKDINLDDMSKELRIPHRALVNIFNCIGETPNSYLQKFIEKEKMRQ